ncbi:MAG: SgcJ/EcaC family oxidoreductase [Jatrophihabitantaceae bacterium]
MIGSYPMTMSAGELDLRKSILHTSAAWAAGDAETFSLAFAEDAVVVIAGVLLQGRCAVRSYIGAAFAGPMRGTCVHSEPVYLRQLTTELVLVITQGGVYLPGEAQVAPDRSLRASWVFSRSEPGWLISAYHSSRPACGGQGPGYRGGRIGHH